MIVDDYIILVTSHPFYYKNGENRNVPICACIKQDEEVDFSTNSFDFYDKANEYRLFNLENVFFINKEIEEFQNYFDPQNLIDKSKGYSGNLKIILDSFKNIDIFHYPKYRDMIHLYLIDILPFNARAKQGERCVFQRMKHFEAVSFCSWIEKFEDPLLYAFFSYFMHVQDLTKENINHFMRQISMPKLFISKIYSNEKFSPYIGKFISLFESINNILENDNIFIGWTYFPIFSLSNITPDDDATQIIEKRLNNGINYLSEYQQLSLKKFNVKYKPDFKVFQDYTKTESIQGGNTELTNNPFIPFNLSPDSPNSLKTLKLIAPNLLEMHMPIKPDFVAKCVYARNYSIYFSYFQFLPSEYGNNNDYLDTSLQSSEFTDIPIDFLKDNYLYEFIIGHLIENAKTFKSHGNCFLLAKQYLRNFYIFGYPVNNIHQISQTDPIINGLMLFIENRIGFKLSNYHEKFETSSDLVNDIVNIIVQKGLDIFPDKQKNVGTFHCMIENAVHIAFKYKAYRLAVILDRFNKQKSNLAEKIERCSIEYHLMLINLIKSKFIYQNDDERFNKDFSYPSLNTISFILDNLDYKEVDVINKFLLLEDYSNEDISHLSNVLKKLPELRKSDDVNVFLNDKFIIYLSQLNS